MRKELIVKKDAKKQKNEKKKRKMKVSLFKCHFNGRIRKWFGFFPYPWKIA